MNRLQRMIVFTLFALVQPAAILAQEAAKAAASTDLYAEIPGTRISLQLPAGFSIAEDFAGILRQDAGALVLVNEIAAPLADMVAGLKEELAAPEITLIRTEEVAINGLTGTLFHASLKDPAGISTLKWILLFGNDSETVMLAAGLPQELEPQFGESIQQCILAAKWFPDRVPDPYAGLGFALQTSETFEIRARRPGGIMLARKEAPDQLNPSEPILLVYTYQSPEVAPLATFAKQQLTADSQFTEYANLSEHPATVNGMTGYEIIADAKVAEIGAAVRILLIAVRSSDRDVIIQGVVSPDNWDKYLPEFRSLAESFQITKGGVRSGH